MRVLNYKIFIRVAYFLLIILFLSCGSDNFYDTQRIILTDKTEYKIGDDIELTLKISTRKDNKTIRLYENFKNLEVSFSTFNEEKGNQNVSLNSGANLKKTKIFEKVISKNNSFIVKFKGKILETDESIILSFPELNFKVTFRKDDLTDDSLIRIHGFCNPINPEFGASLEEYFEVKDIKIIY
ncbi:MAG TPA: phage tail protein [Flavobacterium sp.]|jgi:hypothetical protein